MKPSLVNLPSFVSDTIKRKLVLKNFKNIKASFSELSTKYQNQNKYYFSSYEHRLAYLATRAPSTFGAIKNVFEKIKYYDGFLGIESFLDAGTGPGCGLWAAIDEFENLRQITLIEKDNLIAKIGKSIIEHSNFKETHSIDWLLGSIETLNPEPQPHDLVLASYSLGEISNYVEVAELLWKKTKKWLIIIEPGDRLGFERIKKIRKHLIKKEAKTAAPCPHDLDCPLSNKDWCHFSQKIIRSNYHRRLKAGTLPYEEEKFSYAVFTKLNLSKRPARLIKKPKKASGHILLDLCLPKNIKRIAISKKNREIYQLAKKISWGDIWNFKF